jgi:DNA repair protein RadC
MAAYAFTLKMKAMEVREATGPKVIDSADLAKDFKDIVSLDREAFFCVTLNQRHKIIDRHLVSLGTLTASLVHPREVFRPCLLDSAAAVAFVHNHPSGDCTPSPEDKSLTARLKAGAELLGLRVLDHVIIGREGHYSFAENGLI